MKQFAFLFDQSRCTGCHACSIVCKSWNGIDPGPVKWMRVFQWETGAFPDLRVQALAVPCFHCQNPVCAQACPGKAIHKEENFGAVLVDQAACEAVHREFDCRRCWRACPYGAPQFADDNPRSTMSKCTMCVDRLYDGEKPICVQSCSLRALDFDTLDNLREWYGEGESLPEMPAATRLEPAAIFKRAAPKRQLIPWDASQALRLWQHRGPYAAPNLPALFSSEEDVATPGDAIRRRKLVLKPKTSAELMWRTQDEE